MKFRFCGGLEPPDWLQAEVPLLSGEKTKMTHSDLTAMCEAIGADISVQDLDRAQKLFEDTDDAKAVVAALRFLLTHAAKYDAEKQDLVEELQQLGMQQEDAAAIAQSYEDHRKHIQDQQRAQRFQFAHVEKVEWKVTTSSKVSLKLELDQPAMDCSVSPSSASGHELRFDVSKSKFLALVEELGHAQSMLNSSV